MATYNGWKNYETWNCALWLDNEENTQELKAAWAKQAKNTPKNPVWTRKETTRFTLADLIKEYVKDNVPEIPASMYTDLLNSAIDNIDFQEIADNILTGD